MFLLHHKGRRVQDITVVGVSVCVSVYVSVFYEAILDLIRALALCFFPWEQGLSLKH